MTTWEYLTWYNCTPFKLRELGLQGWELISVTALGEQKMFIFKRKINDA